MTLTRFAGALLLTAALPALASAQDFAGRYELSTRYSNGRRAAVQLEVKESYGRFKVERTSRYTSKKYQSVPACTWSSSEAKRNGRLLVVRYEVGAQDLEGIAARLSPSASRDGVLAALGEGNVFRALYVLSSDGKSLRETVYNTTRLGDESFWRWLESAGKKQQGPSGPGLDAAAFDRVTRDAIKDWYLSYIEDGYADELASATDPDERKRLLEARDNDRDFDGVTEFLEGDEVWDDLVDDQYADGNPYRDDFGKVIPRTDVVVLCLDFFPDLAGIGLSKVFVFHRQSGKLLDESDIRD